RLSKTGQDRKQSGFSTSGMSDNRIKSSFCKGTGNLLQSFYLLVLSLINISNLFRCQFLHNIPPNLYLLYSQSIFAKSLITSNFRRPARAVTVPRQRQII